MASTDLIFSDDQACRQALSEVRSNNSSTNWCLFTYTDEKKGNVLELVSTGTGDVEELKKNLDESKMYYGLIRVTDQIDNSVTVKFVFIIWCGEKVTFIKKAKMTTHKGSITELVGQFHTDLNCSNLGEVNEEIIMNKVRDASGTAVHVKENATPAPQASTPAPQAAASTSSSPSVARSPAPRSSNTTRVPAAPKGDEKRVVSFVNEDGMQEAIRKVRSNNDETDWMLIGYEGKASVKLIANGSDGLEELMGNLKDDQIMYGLYRTTDTVDNTVAIKFVLILWIGEKTPIMSKARITTHKGDITSFFGQYHVDITCTSLDEINEDIVRTHIQKASGTANYVK